MKMSLSNDDYNSNIDSCQYDIRDIIAQQVEIGRRHANNGYIDREGKPDYEKIWTDAQKMTVCPLNGGAGYGIIKTYDGDTSTTPMYCNLCPGCFARHAKQLKQKMDIDQGIAQHNKLNGHWRRKIVDEGKEAQSLKKRIKRNHDGAHCEFAAQETGKNEVWSYVENEPDKTEQEMAEIYGERANPDKIDWDAVYRRNRETGKKMSVGKMFKKPSAANDDKAETIRVALPEIVIEDKDRTKEANTIVRRTNYLEETDDPQKVIELYTYQFHLILKELDQADITVKAIRVNYRNIKPNKLVEDWNKNVKWWMSINAPLDTNDSGAFMDIDIELNKYLYQDGKLIHERKQEITS